MRGEDAWRGERESCVRRKRTVKARRRGGWCAMGMGRHAALRGCVERIRHLLRGSPEGCKLSSMHACLQQQLRAGA